MNDTQPPAAAADMASLPKNVSLAEITRLCEVTVQRWHFNRGMDAAPLTVQIARAVFDALQASAVPGFAPVPLTLTAPARNCGICGQHVADGQYHDCKPVPGAKLDAALQEAAALRRRCLEANAEAKESRRGPNWRELEAMTARRDKALAALREAKADLAACRAELMKEKTNATELRGKLANATSSLETTRLSLADAQESFASVVSQRDAATARVAELEKQLAAMTERAKAWEDSCNRAMTKIAEWKDRAEIAERDRDGYRMAVSRHDCPALVGEVATLTAQRDELAELLRRWAEIISVVSPNTARAMLDELARIAKPEGES